MKLFNSRGRRASVIDLVADDLAPGAALGGHDTTKFRHERSSIGDLNHDIQLL